MVSELLGDRTVRLVILAVLISLLATAMGLTYVAKLVYSAPSANSTRIHMQVEREIDNETMASLLVAMINRISVFGVERPVVRAVSSSEIYADVAVTDPKTLDAMMSTLNQTGKFEGIVDGKVAVSGDGILPGSVRAAQPYPQGGSVTWEVGFALTEAGAIHFADAVRGKAGYPVYLFVDRPESTVILMTRAEVFGGSTLMNSSEGLAALSQAMRKDNSSTPVLLIEDWNATLAQLEALNRSAYSRAMVSQDLSTSRISDLQSMGFEVVRVPREDLMPTYSIGADTITLADWKAAGLLSAPVLNPSITDGTVIRLFSISGAAPKIGTQQDQFAVAQREMTELKAILTSSSLPAKVRVTGVEPVAGAPLQSGEMFDYALICEAAGLVAVIALIIIAAAYGRK